MNSSDTTLTPARCIIYHALMAAQEDRATEVDMGVTLTTQDTPIRYMVDGCWYDMIPFPSAIRSEVVIELARMAEQGVLKVFTESAQHEWTVEFTEHREKCIFVCIKDKYETVA